MPKTPKILTAWLSFSLEPDLKERADAYADRHQMNRSHMIREALRSYLDRHEATDAQ